jgi:SAM-dependent methyltransferase
MINCPLCCQSGAQRQFSGRDRVHGMPGEFSIYHCQDCDAYFIQPWLTAQELLRYYPEDYGRFRHGDSLKKKRHHDWRRFILEHHYGYPSQSSLPQSRAVRIAARVLSWVTAKGVIPYRGSGKVLDIGTGGGSYLYRLKQWGWNTFGVEPSETGCQRARSLGLNVIHGTLEAARYPDSFFDVVHLSNVLEHLPNPYATFEEIYRILRPDGLIYVTVPNTHSLVFWLFREYWYAIDVPRHVISYSPKTLRTLAEMTGFTIQTQDFSAGPFNFVRSVKCFLEDNRDRYPSWLRRINWDHSKLIRRALKPFFILVDFAGYGDFLHATLLKSSTFVPEAYPVVACLGAPINSELALASNHARENPAQPGASSLGGNRAA